MLLLAAFHAFQEIFQRCGEGRQETEFEGAWSGGWQQRGELGQLGCTGAVLVLLGVRIVLRQGEGSIKAWLTGWFVQDMSTDCVGGMEVSGLFINKSTNHCKSTRLRQSKGLRA